jgi:hypothetical protein
MESKYTLTASKRILVISKVILTASIAILMVFTSTPTASSSTLTTCTVYLPSHRNYASTLMATTVTLTVSAISLMASRNTIKTSTIILTAYSSTLKPPKSFFFGPLTYATSSLTASRSLQALSWPQNARYCIYAKVSLSHILFLVKFYFSTFFKFFPNFFQTNSLQILFFSLQMFSCILYHHLSTLCDFDDQIGMFC